MTEKDYFIMTIEERWPCELKRHPELSGFRIEVGKNDYAPRWICCLDKGVNQHIDLTNFITNDKLVAAFKTWLRSYLQQNDRVLSDIGKFVESIYEPTKSAEHDRSGVGASSNGSGETISTSSDRD